MSAQDTAIQAPAGEQRRSHARIALAVIVACQLMVVLDSTIVNVALPSIARNLHFTPTGLSWVTNAYMLTFGGFLLLGGRAGDILGRRRVFVLGIVLFTIASVAGGVANVGGVLIAARAVQGIGAAIASPNALALIATNFEGEKRGRAIGIYAAVSGAGGAIGLIAGGMLTEWESWRWVFFVNIPFGVVVAVLTPLVLLPGSRISGRFDLGGALTSTAGIVALSYGLIRGSSNGWTDSLTVLALAVAVVMLTAFVAIETRVKQPIMPLALFAHRSRASAYLILLLLTASLMSMFFFLTQFLQNGLGFTPLAAGAAFLPASIVTFALSQVTTRVLPKFGAKPLMIVGAAATTVGMVWLSQISLSTSYWTGIFGPLVLFGVGIGVLFTLVTRFAMSDVPPQQAGAAGGMANMVQRLGGSLGLAILVVVFAGADHASAHTTLATRTALAHGVAAAFTVGTVFAVLTLLLTVFAVKTSPSPAPAVPAPQKAAA
jgi:EmrB/QacA subfamily drug resistance transporter